MVDKHVYQKQLVLYACTRHATPQSTVRKFVTDVYKDEHQMQMVW